MSTLAPQIGNSCSNGIYDNKTIVVYNTSLQAYLDPAVYNSLVDSSGTVFNDCDKIYDIY